MRRVSSVVGVAAALITTSFIVAPDMAAAAPCGTTTLNNWLGATFSCTVGDLTFSGFSYSPDGFTLVPATSVGVGVATTGLPGVQFNAFWDNPATSGAAFDAAITFTVTAPATDPITDFHLLLGGAVGPVLDVASSSSFTLTSSDNLEHSVSFAPVTSLTVRDDIGVNPGGSVSIVDKQFSQVAVPGPVVGAGLPGLVMACGGLLGLARRRRRRTA
jgi:hypothetical protein